MDGSDGSPACVWRYHCAHAGHVNVLTRMRGPRAHLDSLLDPLDELLAVGRKAIDGDAAARGELVDLWRVARLDRVALGLARVAGDDGEGRRGDGQDGPAVFLLAGRRQRPALCPWLERLTVYGSNRLI